MKYIVRYSQSIKQYRILDTTVTPHQTHSVWPTKPLAEEIAARMNRQASIGSCGFVAGRAFYGAFKKTG